MIDGFIGLRQFLQPIFLPPSAGAVMFVSSLSLMLLTNLKRFIHPKESIRTYLGLIRNDNRVLLQHIISSEEVKRF